MNGKKIERPKQKRRSGKSLTGKYARGRACQKCRQVRPYCKCDIVKESSKKKFY